MNSASTSVSVKTTSERKFTTKPKPGQQVDLEVSQIIQIKIATRFFYFFDLLMLLRPSILKLFSVNSS
jgi:hypothetical protein